MPQIGGGDEDGRHADLIITRDAQDLPETHKVGQIFSLTQVECVIDWPSMARFTIASDNHINVERFSGASDALINLVLLGHVMALLLHRRGMTVLHGSALSVGGDAVAFVGDKGAGKSTLAAACLNAGHGLLSDDIVAVSDKTSEAMVEPSSARFKLTPETDSAIRLDWASLQPAPDPEFPKVIRDAGASFRSSHEPLRRVYVIQRGAEAKIEPLAPAAALQALLRFSYIVRFGDYIMRVGDGPDQLGKSARLADKVRVLTVPDDLTALEAAVRCVEQDLARAAEVA
jgi:energy-coupling factor transporter ATP-binding protein EcfA2